MLFLCSSNIRSIKVSGFVILLIKHKIYQVNIRLFEKILYFWNHSNIWAIFCNLSKKVIFWLFFSFSVSTYYLKGNKNMMRYAMKTFQIGTRYCPLLLKFKKYFSGIYSRFFLSFSGKSMFFLFLDF